MLTSYQSGNNVFGAYKKFNAMIPLQGVPHLRLVKVWNNWFWDEFIQGAYQIKQLNYAMNVDQNTLMPPDFALVLYKIDTYNAQEYMIPVFTSANGNNKIMVDNIEYGAWSLNVPINNNRLRFTNTLSVGVELIYFELLLTTVIYD